jgi:hypothetical protein
MNVTNNHRDRESGHHTLPVQQKIEVIRKLIERTKNRRDLGSDHLEITNHGPFKSVERI